MTNDRNNRPRYTTLDMINALDSGESLDDFEKNFNDDLITKPIHVGIYLNELLGKYNVKSASKLSNDSCLDPSYIGLIIAGRKNPSREALLCICLTLGTDIEETQTLLKHSGYPPLYVRNMGDAIIYTGIINHESLDDVNEKLKDKGFAPLYREKSRNRNK